MNGIAIVIPGADFSGSNLGTVTFLENVDVSGITIVADDSYVGTTFTPYATYSPANTLQQGCTWSITSGAQYATINSSSGVVSIISGASLNTIQIEAVSTYNTDLIATKNVVVTYSATIDELNSIVINGDSSIVGVSGVYTVTYSPANTSYSEVIWSITTGSSYATINSSSGVLTILSGASSSSVTIKATSVLGTGVDLSAKFMFCRDWCYEIIAAGGGVFNVNIKKTTDKQYKSISVLLKQLCLVS